MTTTIPIATAGKTIRQIIIDSLKEVLRNMQDGDPAQNVWQTTFTGDIEDRDNRSCPFASLDEGTENVIEMYGGCTQKELPVFVHFRFNAPKGVDAHDVFKYYLGLIQRAFLPLHEDHDNFPHLRDIREDSNAHYIINTKDAYTGGTVVFMVDYEHARNDPYRQAGAPE